MASGVAISALECCISWEIANNWRMKNRDHVSSIIEPTESEGVFTTAQAARNARWVIWRGKGRLYFKSLPLYLLP